VADHLPELRATMSRPNLDTLRAFLSTSTGAAAIWAQLIAWDLFIGRWMHLESRSLRIHPLVMAPVYALTILLSPFGFSTFLVVRSVAASGVMQETRGPRWLPASNEG
jgi:hypothetical protein